MHRFLAVPELWTLGFMRVMVYILLLAGAWSLVDAGYDQHRGTTSKPAYMFHRGIAVSLPSGDIERKTDAAAFHNAMTFHWFSSFVTLIAGLILYRMIRRQERLDPFSPDFDRRDEQ